MRIDGYYNREPIGLSDNPEEATFSFAHVVIPFELSTWHTDAPAAKHATVAPPVYANRFNTFISFLLLFCIFSIIRIRKKTS